MQSIGQILKKNRASRNLEILDVSKELKISKEILMNLESDYIPSNIDIVYLIGHLRSYCNFLNIDENEIVKQFKDIYLTNESKNVEIKRPLDANNSLFSYKLISLLLIVIIFSSFYFLFIEVDNTKREYALIPDLPENYISTIEEANLNSTFENTKIANNEVKNYAKFDVNKSSSSVVASIPLIEDHKSKATLVTLKFLDDAWLQIRDTNDEIIISQLMNKNDEYSYNLDLNYSITSGNAGHIMVLIDQKVRGKIGKKGQVVDSIVLEQDFIN